MLSICVPYYNESKYILSLLYSIEGCGCDFEIVVCDDGSKSRAFVSVLFQIPPELRKRLKVIRKANGGLSAARNDCVKAAEGAFIYFIDSDDLTSVDGLEALYRDIQKSEKDFIVGAHICFNRKLTYFFDSDQANISSINYMVANWSSGMGCRPINSLICRASVYNRFSFDESLQGFEDYYLWKYLSDHCDGYISPIVISLYRDRAFSMSKNKKIMKQTKHRIFGSD